MTRLPPPPPKSHATAPRTEPRLGQSQSAPWATTALFLVATASVGWCLHVVVWMIYEMVNLLQMSNDGYSVILPRFGVQAGLLGLTLVLWLTARRRDERWASPREQAAGWGLAPAFADSGSVVAGDGLSPRNCVLAEPVARRCRLRRTRRTTWRSVLEIRYTQTRFRAMRHHPQSRTSAEPLGRVE